MGNKFEDTTQRSRVKFPIRSLQKDAGNNPSCLNEESEVHAKTNRTSNLKSKFKGLSINMAAKYEAKNVGLGEVATGELKIHHGPVEEHEARVRAQSTSCWLMRFTTTLASAVMVFVVYLITLETLLSCTLCVGLTIYWYREVR